MSDADSNKSRSKPAQQKSGRKPRQRPLLSLPQILVLAGVIAALFIALDLSRRAQIGREVLFTEAAVKEDVSLELTRQVELQATVDFVHSQDYVAAYAREEAGQLLPGERRIVPLIVDATPVPTPVPLPTPDPAYIAKPWQAWWRLMTDAPMPVKEP